MGQKQIGQLESGEMSLNMEEIKEWFDSDKWDIGYLTKEQLEI